MDEKQKQIILEKAKELFRNKFAINQIKKLKKLNKLSSFKYNPFLLSYKGAFLTGEVSAESTLR